MDHRAFDRGWRSSLVPGLLLAAEGSISACDVPACVLVSKRGGPRGRIALNFIRPQSPVAAVAVQITAFDPHFFAVIVTQDREGVLLFVCAVRVFDNQARNYLRACPPRVWVRSRPNGLGEPHVVTGARVTGAVFGEILVHGLALHNIEAHRREFVNVTVGRLHILTRFEVVDHA